MTWSIAEGPSGGSITGAGAYTAPAVDGVYHVVATSRADPTKSDTATVAVALLVSTSTGDMASARLGHTATLLPNGQVFVAGGSILPGGATAEGAERFDPATGAFQSAGTVARQSHTATLLANGDVLLAGGFTDRFPSGNPILTATAELLKAGTGSLQPTGSMSVPRLGHTATLLQDGRVLIVEGLVPTETGTTNTRTAELYDPSSGTFVTTGNTTSGHTFHTAILLSTGKVLITGDGTAELFDPATNSFTATDHAPAARFAATVTLLQDGRVLIAGGEIYYDDYYLGPSELYDPVTGQFTSTGTLVTPRLGHTATLLPDGTVLIAGGDYDASNTPTGATEIYRPTTGSFTIGLPMMQARAEHTATLLTDGSVLLIGGITLFRMGAASPLPRVRRFFADSVACQSRRIEAMCRDPSGLIT